MTAFRSLRYRDYRLVWTGAIISNTGTWMQNVALSWYVLQLTGSAFWVGAVTFFNFVPMWLSPLGGVLADRFDRRRILLVTQSAMMVAALVLGVVSAAEGAGIVAVMLLTLLSGLAFAVDAPTRQAFFPSLVPREAMVNAIALNSAQFSLARVIGPAIGGVLVATVGVTPVFWVNAASFLAVLGALAAVRSRPVAASPDARRTPSGLRAGLRYAWRDPMVRVLILSVAVLSVFASPVSALLPVYARDVFGRGAGGFGLLAAALGVGSVIGAVALGRLGRVRPGMIAAGLALAGIALVGLALSRIFVLGLVAMLVFGAAYLFAISATNSQIQISVDESVRARVLGLFLLAFGGLFPLGSLVAGAVATRIGVETTTIAGAAICVVWGAGLAWRWRRVPRPEVEPAPS
jgi:MFS family permease